MIHLELVDGIYPNHQAYIDFSISMELLDNQIQKAKSRKWDVPTKDEDFFDEKGVIVSCMKLSGVKKFYLTIDFEKLINDRLSRGFDEEDVPNKKVARRMVDALRRYADHLESNLITGVHSHNDEETTIEK